MVGGRKSERKVAAAIGAERAGARQTERRAHGQPRQLARVEWRVGRQYDVDGTRPRLWQVRIEEMLPDGRAESRPRSDLKRPWSLVRKRAGLDASAENPALRVRIHDLRHTHASIGVGANLGLPIIGKLLGHTQARTTERYAHLEADPLRKASDAIGRRIADALGDGGPAPAGNVIPMKSGSNG